MKVAVRNSDGTRIQHNTYSSNKASRPKPNGAGSSKSKAVAPSKSPDESTELLSSLQAGQDRFQFNSLIAQICLIQVFKYTEGQYAARNSAGHRLVQTGHAWRTFSRLFDSRNAMESVRLFENLLRFANDEAHALARSFFLAYAPLSFEHDESGEFIGPGVWTPNSGSRTAAVRVRRTLKRWCEWLEALAHFRIHESHCSASNGRQLDKAIIFLWPMLKRHDWNYDELLNLLRILLGCGNAYPCGSEAQLNSYCRSILGLRKIKAASVAARVVLPGQVVAERLFKFLPAIQ